MSKEQTINDYAIINQSRPIKVAVGGGKRGKRGESCDYGIPSWHESNT